MGHCNKNKSFKKINCGCNKSCGNNNSLNEDCSKCAEYKNIANEKCEKANCIMNKANKVAQMAKQAEDRAEALKQQAIEECAKANQCWEEYKNLSNKGLMLMEEAKQCLTKSAECYKDCYESDFGCDLEDFGYKPNNNDCNCNCNCGCHNNWC